MKSISLALAAATLAWAGAGVANAQDHRFQIVAGAVGVLPDEGATISTIGGTVEISDEVVPSVQLEYFFNENISAQLLCCIATHQVTAVQTAVGPTGRVDLGEVTLFPPTVTVKYRWTNLGNVEPYVGAGVNYTHFFDANLPAGGPVTSIEYDDSFGLALQAGADIRVNDNWFVNVDARRIWINTDVSLVAGAPITADVDINPWVITAGVGYRF